MISRSHLDGRQHGGLGPPKGISSHDPHPKLGWAAVFRRWDDFGNTQVRSCFVSTTVDFMWFSFVFFIIIIIIILADVGGFFKNPDPELLLRWYQVGFLSSHMIYSFFSFFFPVFFFLAKLRGVVGREQRKFARGLRCISVTFFQQVSFTWLQCVFIG